jgi:starch phosphorylase
VAPLRAAIEMIDNGFFAAEEPTRFRGLVEGLLVHGDHYLLLADFEAYAACQREVDRRYLDPVGWTQSAILNVAHMGRFSSDRTIAEYAREIWQIEPAPTILTEGPVVSVEEEATRN